jgi:hypothetical protein
LKRLADPTRFERATFAFGGQFQEAAGLCAGLILSNKSLVYL